MVLDRIGGPLAVRVVPDPDPPRGGVVVQVLATGMCRSDWHAWAGHDEISLPHVPGHELAGVIAAVGDGVSRWSVGDRVTVPFVQGCGRCRWCRPATRRSARTSSSPASPDWGSFAQYVALYAADVNLVAIPEAVTFEAAAALGCRFATSYRALTGRARLSAGEWVTVVGAGGAGLSAVMIAKALGARVIAVDRNPGALAAASALGADHVLTADGSLRHPRLGPRAHRGRQRRRHRRGRQRAGLRGLDPLAAPPRQARPGRAAAPGGRASAGADGPRHRLGARPARQPRDGRRRLPGHARPDRTGRAGPQALIERVISLDEAAALLPAFDTAAPAGMTMIDPRRSPQPS